MVCQSDVKFIVLCQWHIAEENNGMKREEESWEKKSTLKINFIQVKMPSGIDLPFNASSCLPSCINRNPTISPSLNVFGVIDRSCAPPDADDDDADEVERALLDILCCCCCCCNFGWSSVGVGVVNAFVHPTMTRMMNRRSGVVDREFIFSRSFYLFNYVYVVSSER